MRDAQNPVNVQNCTVYPKVRHRYHQSAAPQAALKMRGQVRHKVDYTSTFYWIVYFLQTNGMTKNVCDGLGHG
jgi:hypothetical protein